MKASVEEVRIVSEVGGDKSTSRSESLGVMEGKGFYSKHSKPQHSAVAFGLRLLDRTVESVAPPAPRDMFQVADYGVAGGSNSMELMRAVIDAVRRRGSKDLPVCIFHTDILTLHVLNPRR